MQSEMEFEGVDMRWATVYCALNMTQAEINREELNLVIPVKRARQGKRPTILTVYDEEKGFRWKWVRDPEKYTK